MPKRKLKIKGKLRSYNYEPIECYFNNNGCLIHSNHLGDKRGYGRIRRDGKYFLLHRWIFYINNGYLPEVVMHTCDNPFCINPSHLMEGTFKKNSEDMVNKKRHCYGTKNKGGTKLDDEKVKEIKKLIPKLSLQKIANNFGVSKKAILLIKQNKHWKHITK